MSKKHCTLFTGTPIRLNDWGLICYPILKKCELFSQSVNSRALRVINDYYEKNITDNIEDIKTFNDENCPSFNVGENCAHPVIAFCKVISQNKEKVCLLRTALSCTKIYVNSKLIAANSEAYGGVSTFSLNKGENLFIIEFYPPFGYPVIAMRLSGYVEETECNLSSILSSNAYINEYDVNIVSNGNYLCNKDKFCFFIQLNNALEINGNQVINAFFQCRNPNLNVNYINKRSIDATKKYHVKKNIPKLKYIGIKRKTKSIALKFNQVYSFDINKLQFEDPLSFSNLIFFYTYINNNGKKITKQTDIFVHEASDGIGRLRQKAEKMFNDTNLTDYDKCALGYFLQSIPVKSSDFIGDYFNAIYLDTIIKTLICSHMDQTIYKPYPKNIYYYSKIDNSYEKLFVNIPSNYDPSKKYPLFVFCATQRYSVNSAFCTFDNFDYISVDVTGRGITLGSYIGEIAILEAIEKTLEHYSIDDSKIYLIGTSNGASAAYNLATQYPHLFAGICTFSGLVDKTKILNMYNLKTINVSSEFENVYDLAYRYILPNMKKINHFQGVLIKNMTHSDLTRMVSNQAVKDELYKSQVNEFPNTIFFTTRSHRARKAYWVEIGGIKKNKTTAKIVARIENNDIILNAQNVVSIKVNVPPQIHTDEFNIILNGKKHYFFNCNTVSFASANRGYQVVECFDDNVTNRKGTGILDVFLRPVRIIVPKNPCDEIMAVAKSFASPQTNGYDSHIFVNYPIAKSNDIPVEFLECSQVVIDNNSEDEYIENIRNICKIKTNINGFDINGNYCVNYCIMQVVISPFDNDKTILYINCNDVSLLKGNLFTRRIIIPSNVNGIHPYLNSEAIIYCNDRYHTVYELN